MKRPYVIAGTICLTIIVSIFFVFPVSAGNTDAMDRIIAELEVQIAEMERILKRHELSTEDTVHTKDIMIEAEPSEIAEQAPESSTSSDTGNIIRGGNSGAVNQTECLRIGRVMRFGDYREDITKLQKFLEDTGYFSHPHITWYFGSVTQKAVQDFQTAEGIISHGTPQTTGFGQVGPITAKAIERISCQLQ